MRIGIIGRHESMLQTAVAKTRELGHAGVGTVDDAVALNWLEAKAVDALVIGGGVEPASRHILIEACSRSGVAAHEVFGPGNLERTLRSL
jgi:hypothetical protein